MSPGRATGLALLSGAPAVVVAVAALATVEALPVLRWTVALGAIGWWLGWSLRLRSRFVNPLRTLSSLLAGLREGDFATRARVPSSANDDPLADAMREANALADVLKEQRLGAVDATTLLRKVMEQADFAVIAFDDDAALRLANAGAEALLGAPAERLRGAKAEALGLHECLHGETPRLLDPSFGGGGARWELRRAAFRQRGRPHQLLVLTDLSRALHEEEREAWKRLVRVISHEINNSLAPISSIASSLETRRARDADDPDWDTDLSDGLRIISERSEALGRFIGAHAELARLPAPTLGRVDVGAWVRRVAALETRTPIDIEPGADVQIDADGDQLDQLLINLVRNAADAALETRGTVRMGWTTNPDMVEVWIRDDGPGLPPRANLFVPLFTTKPGGSGIGLALARQIALAHRGQLTLDDREDSQGCVARVKLPRLVPT